MNRKIALLTLGLVGGGLAGCGDLPPSDSTALSEPQPDYRRIVLQNLQLGRRSDAPEEISVSDPPSIRSPERIIIVNPEKLGPIEISGVRRIQHNTQGWVWLTCLRAHPEGRPPIDYAIFIANQIVVDARISVVIDDCANQRYERLEDGRLRQKEFH